MNIFIGRLSAETSEKDLYVLFKEFGYVDNCYLVRDKISKKSRGYAYVIIRDEQEAQNAISNLNGYELNGEKMMVKKARSGEIRFIREESQNP